MKPVYIINMCSVGEKQILVLDKGITNFIGLILNQIIIIMSLMNL